MIEHMSVLHGCSHSQVCIGHLLLSVQLVDAMPDVKTANAIVETIGKCSNLQVRCCMQTISADCVKTLFCHKLVKEVSDRYSLIS